MAEVLSGVDRSVAATDQGLTDLHSLRRALMQQLLTGRVRVA